MSNLLLNFPETYIPNKSQVSILNRIDNALKNDKKFIIINAPPGSGKSFISKSLANISRDASDNFKEVVSDYRIFGDDGPQLIDGEDSFGCYTLTITKSLQDQYRNTFSDTGILKGQSNYQCAVDTTCTVDVAPCIFTRGMKNNCWKAGNCPYYSDRNSMLKRKFSALNYSMFFSLPDHLKKRQFIVCDEGSELEDQVVQQFTCEIDIPFLVKCNVTMYSLPVSNDSPKILDWLINLNNSCVLRLEEYVKILKESTDIIETNKRKTEYTKLLNLQKSLVILCETYYDSEYLIEKIEKIIKFIPLKINKLTSHIFDYADHVIIMSATIIDPPNFCKSLGITDYEYISVDSTFDPEKSPIFIKTSQKLNFSNLRTLLPKLVDDIECILDDHKNDKGIIHTHTQYITDYVRDNVNSSRLLCRQSGVTNEEILNMHESSSEPTVLVSPSMTYGVDLKGDLAKFQIIMKAPWLPTKETRIERMMKMDRRWYANKMICTLIQSSTRGVRGEDDECVTYILDGSIYDAILKNKQHLPKYFLDRCQ